MDKELQKKCKEFMFPSCIKQVKEEPCEKESFIYAVDGLSQNNFIYSFKKDRKLKSKDELSYTTDFKSLSCSLDINQIKEEQCENEAAAFAIDGLSHINSYSDNKDVKQESEESLTSSLDSNLPSCSRDAEHAFKSSNKRLDYIGESLQADLQHLSKIDVANEEFSLTTNDSTLAERESYLSDLGKGKKHKCLDCDSEFCLKSDLSKHVLAIHLKFRPFQCPECEKTFTRKNNLSRHSLSVHKKIKLHQCLICEDAFSEKFDLAVHIKTVHERTGEFKCSYCGSPFIERNHLSYHILAIHEKKPPYKCWECDCMLKNKGELYNHIRIVHKVT